MKKLVSLLLCLAVITVMLTGCGQTQSSSASSSAQSSSGAQQSSVSSSASGASSAASGTTSSKPYTFGVSLYYRSDEFYVDIENMMKINAEKAGIKLDIQDANADSSAQLRQFEDFIQMGVDAIIFSPCDPSACVSAVQSANKAGIPVFTYDGVMDDKSGIAAGLYSDFYSDGHDAGEWAKDYISKNLGGKAKVAILDYPASAVVCGLRANGFEEAVKELPGVEVVARQDGKATRTGGMEVMENILTANSNEVDVVFAINYESGAGAAAAIQAAGAKGIVVPVAWGKEALQKIEDNDPYIKALLLGDPSDQANIINLAKDYLDGKKVDAETYYKYYMVEHDTLDKLIDWKYIISLRG